MVTPEDENASSQAIRLKKPRAVLLEVSGTLTQSSFITSLLVPYFVKNYRSYLERNCNEAQCRNAIDKLRLAAEQDDSAPKIVPSTAKREDLVESIEYCLEKNKDQKAFVVFRFMVWFDGYDRDQVVTPCYGQAAIQIQKWRLTQGVQLYVLSKGWRLATQKFLEKTTQGNLAMLIEDFFDTEMGSFHRTATYLKLVEKVHQRSQDLVFLTKCVDEVHAAKEAGITAILVLARSKTPDNVQDIDHVGTINEIEFE